MELITTKTALASDMGVSNNLFGGVMLSWLDLSGAAYAAQLTDSPRLVTKKFEEVIFEKPVKIGNLIKIYGGNAKFGTTSITMDIEARKHNVENGKQFCVCKTTVVYVKINDEGVPVKVSDRVKIRYQLRLERYGRAILSPEEIEKELSEDESDIDIFRKAQINGEMVLTELVESGAERAIDMLDGISSQFDDTKRRIYLNHMSSFLYARSKNVNNKDGVKASELRSLVREMSLRPI